MGEGIIGLADGFNADCNNKVALTCIILSCFHFNGRQYNCVVYDLSVCVALCSLCANRLPIRRFLAQTRNSILYTQMFECA